MVFGRSPVVEKAPDYGLVMTCPFGWNISGISTNCHCKDEGDSCPTFWDALETWIFGNSGVLFFGGLIARGQPGKELTTST